MRTLLTRYSLHTAVGHSKDWFLRGIARFKKKELVLIIIAASRLLTGHDKLQQGRHYSPDCWILGSREPLLHYCLVSLVSFGTRHGGRVDAVGIQDRFEILQGLDQKVSIRLQNLRYALLVWVVHGVEQFVHERLHGSLAERNLRAGVIVQDRLCWIRSIRLVAKGIKTGKVGFGTLVVVAERRCE